MRDKRKMEKNMKKLFAKLITPLVFAATVIFAGCSNPNSSSASSSDVPRGSVIAATYSSEGGGGTQIVFNEDSTVVFIENSGNSGASARAAVALSEDNVCASGTYVITADNIAQITIMEVICGWGGISKEKLESYNEEVFAINVAFSGNELHITVDENPLFFSTDKKDVSKPFSGSLFSNGPVDATYLFKQTLTLKENRFSIVYNITFDYDDDIEGPVQGTYTKPDDNTITLTFDKSAILGGDEVTKATATINGDILTLTIEYKSDGKSYTEKTSLKKRGSSDKEWEHSEQIKLSSSGKIEYYENGKLCWKGTYTIIGTETASVKVNEKYDADSFGFSTTPGNLYIEDASQEFLDLDLHNLDEKGGVAMPFAREK